MAELALSIWTSSFPRNKEILKEEFFDFFQKNILNFFNFVLSSSQISYLDFLIDQKNAGIIKISDWKNFVDNYWNILSWRGNFFKEKFNIITEEPIFEKEIFKITIQKTDKEENFLSEKKNVINDADNYLFDFKSKIVTIGKNMHNTIVLEESDCPKILSIGFSKKGLVLRDLNKNKESSLLIKIDHRKFILHKNNILKIGKTLAIVKEVYHGKIKIDEFKENENEGSSKKEDKYINLSHEYESLIEKNQDKIYFICLIIDDEEYRLDALGNKSFIIGRSHNKEIDLKIKNMDVSKLHCLIGFEEGKGWWISDVKSFQIFFKERNKKKNKTN
jgi:FHA domain